MPSDPFLAHDRLDVEIGKTPYARFDLNAYSIPHGRTQRSLTLLADIDTVRIVDKNELLATQIRSWDRGQQVEHPEHLARLVAEKKRARDGRTRLPATHSPVLEYCARFVTPRRNPKRLRAELFEHGGRGDLIFAEIHGRVIRGE